MLDAVFSEDECGLLSENGLQSFNAFRKLALLVHKQFMGKQNKKTSVKANLLKCLISEKWLLEVIRSL